jgi:filamentous hemagglutinin
VLAQLGGDFTQVSVSDDLHTSFTAAGGGFGIQQLAAIVVAVVATIVTYGAASAAIGATLGATEGTFAAATATAAAGLGNIAASAGIAGVVSSVASQEVSSGSVNWGSAFETGAVAAITAGLTNGITYNPNTGIGFTTQPIALGGGTSSLASLAGVNPAIGNTASQATSATATTLESRGLAIISEAGISAGVATAIEGGSFGDALTNNLTGDLAAAGAFAIGNAQPALISDLGPVGGEAAYIAAHGLLGCAAGAAEGTGCAGGAIGGATSATLSPWMIGQVDPTGAQPTSEQAALTTAIAMLAGGSLAGALGQNVAGAATAAENQVENNDLKHLICLLCAFTSFAQTGDIKEDPNWGLTLPAEALQEELKDNVEPTGALNPFGQNPPKR